MDVSWRGSRISVVFPTYNERDSIRAAIVDFASTDVVDEIRIMAEADDRADVPSLPAGLVNRLFARFGTPLQAL